MKFVDLQGCYPIESKITRMPKQKLYVVWKGRKTGIFSSWAECERQVKGYVGAEFKAFETRGEAQAALAAGYAGYVGKASSSGRWRMAGVKPLLPSLCVDAACEGSPGRLEYRGVNTETGEPIFHAGPFADGTNNVGEFLAIVLGSDWLAHHHHDWPIYSDSENAIGWVKAKKCNTKLARLPSNQILFELIAKAEQNLRNSDPVKVLKWDTRAWGENPADFGRK